MVYQDATGLYHFVINVIPFISNSVGFNCSASNAKFYIQHSIAYPLSSYRRHTHTHTYIHTRTYINLLYIDGMHTYIREFNKIIYRL